MKPVNDQKQKGKKMNNHIENDNEELKPFAFTSYRNAVEYAGNKYILCNNIAKLDEYLFDNCELCNPNEEFYQYFLTDCSEYDAERLHQWFGLNFLYSEKIGLYVLAVDHWGTSWDYVSCGVYDEFVANCIKRNGLEFKH